VVNAQAVPVQRKIKHMPSTRSAQRKPKATGASFCPLRRAHVWQRTSSPTFHATSRPPPGANARGTPPPGPPPYETPQGQKQPAPRRARQNSRRERRSHRPMGDSQEETPSEAQEPPKVRVRPGQKPCWRADQKSNGKQKINSKQPTSNIQIQNIKQYEHQSQKVKARPKPESKQQAKTAGNRVL